MRHGYERVEVKTIKMWDVPDDVHAALRVEAAAAGLSLSAYMLRISIRAAEGRTVAEVLARAEQRPFSVSPGEAVDAVRRGRGNADRP
jgi:plasmid stability protein